MDHITLENLKSFDTLDEINLSHNRHKRIDRDQSKSARMLKNRCWICGVNVANKNRDYLCIECEEKFPCTK